MLCSLPLFIPLAGLCLYSLYLYHFWCFANGRILLFLANCFFPSPWIDGTKWSAGSTIFICWKLFQRAIPTIYAKDKKIIFF